MKKYFSIVFCICVMFSAASFPVGQCKDPGFKLEMVSCLKFEKSSVEGSDKYCKDENGNHNFVAGKIACHCDFKESGFMGGCTHVTGTKQKCVSLERSDPKCPLEVKHEFELELPNRFSQEKDCTAHATSKCDNACMSEVQDPKNQISCCCK